ncbi:mechanosensitive ion channel family protein [Solimonas sp. K1W22B-7]|uniref:mechanosensitive ion channel family protein n=1 Tax=Solimonas sp. K1W22B-7 TaxID=2303331 RepID=UPI000E335EB7|nr:mechanosensitive ion channel domain-containing protein [Solimonas sp. K1W22B-7]AXQ29221.1 mechanosensitive ion channel family protein [Solimonas sp. K1W22B-7]
MIRLREWIETLFQYMSQEPLKWSVLVLLGALAWAWLLHKLFRTLNAGRYSWQRRLRVWMGVAPNRSIGELFWLLLAMHLVLWPIVAHAVLRIWGLHDEARDLLVAVFSDGITFGKTTVVPGKLLMGALWFVLLFTFTRWLKKKMEFGWLPRTGIEFSTRESLATLFGYVTFLIAAIAGLSVAGLDFSKIAIVAGALSVGIGFGLQNIVNNFISGLILLFERPVRTGDYIFVSGTEGIVRKIRIRSTEIQTAERESVIIPNSDLLSNPLRNRDLRDPYGRVVIKLGVAYGSDPDKVRRVLLRLAFANPHVVRENQISGLIGPAVYLVDFGENALMFELRAYVLEVDQRLSVSSDLRYAIVEAFKREGIDIPFPQRDVWVRGLPAAKVDGQGPA